MNKIEEIFKSWGIMLNPNNIQNELAAARMEICDICEFKKTKPVIHCGECGCALKAKVYSPTIGACPKNKWIVPEMRWEHEKNKNRYNNIK